MAECSRPAHYRCSKCGKQGHVRPACRQQAIANNAAGPKQTDDLTQQLASLTVSNPPAAQHEDVQTVHSLYSTAPNQPTPKVFL